MKKSLYIKVGNSQIAWSINAKKFQHESTIKFSLKVWKRRLKNIEKIVAFGVVPTQLKKIRQLSKALNISYRELKLSDIPIRSAYKKGIGIDRVINAWAAFNIFKSASVVIDFGTAVTAEFINSKGKHLGGFIVVGPRLALESLYKGTALIPKVERVSSVVTLPGKNSEECLSRGHIVLYQGFLFEIQKIAKTILGSKYKIIVTGGAGRQFASRQTPYVEELGLSSLIHLQLQ